MIELYKGEKRLCGMSVKSRSGKSFLIESVSCKVVDNAGITIQEDEEGIVEDHSVFCLVDTTLDGYVYSKGYILQFSIVLKDVPKIIMGKLSIKIKK